MSTTMAIQRLEDLKNQIDDEIKSNRIQNAVVNNPIGRTAVSVSRGLLRTLGAHKIPTMAGATEAAASGGGALPDAQNFVNDWGLESGAAMAALFPLIYMQGHKADSLDLIESKKRRELRRSARKELTFGDAKDALGNVSKGASRSLFNTAILAQAAQLAAPSLMKSVGGGLSHSSYPELLGNTLGGISHAGSWLTSAGKYFPNTVSDSLHGAGDTLYKLGDSATASGYGSTQDVGHLLTSNVDHTGALGSWATPLIAGGMALRSPLHASLMAASALSKGGYAFGEAFKHTDKSSFLSSTYGAVPSLLTKTLALPGHMAAGTANMLGYNEVGKKIGDFSTSVGDSGSGLMSLLGGGPMGNMAAIMIGSMLLQKGGQLSNNLFSSIAGRSSLKMFSDQGTSHGKFIQLPTTTELAKQFDRTMPLRSMVRLGSSTGQLNYFQSLLLNYLDVFSQNFAAMEGYFAIQMREQDGNKQDNKTTENIFQKRRDYKGDQESDLSEAYKTPSNDPTDGVHGWLSKLVARITFSAANNAIGLEKWYNEQKSLFGFHNIIGMGSFNSVNRFNKVRQRDELLEGKRAMSANTGVSLANVDAINTSASEASGMGESFQDKILSVTKGIYTFTQGSYTSLLDIYKIMGGDTNTGHQNMLGNVLREARDSYSSRFTEAEHDEMAYNSAMSNTPLLFGEKWARRYAKQVDMVNSRTGVDGVTGNMAQTITAYGKMAAADNGSTGFAQNTGVDTSDILTSMYYISARIVNMNTNLDTLLTTTQDIAIDTCDLLTTTQNVDTNMSRATGFINSILLSTTQTAINTETIAKYIKESLINRNSGTVAYSIGKMRESLVAASSNGVLTALRRMVTGFMRTMALPGFEKGGQVNPGKKPSKVDDTIVKASSGEVFLSNDALHKLGSNFAAAINEGKNPFGKSDITKSWLKSYFDKFLVLLGDANTIEAKGKMAAKVEPIKASQDVKIKQEAKGKMAAKVEPVKASQDVTKDAIIDERESEEDKSRQNRMIKALEMVQKSITTFGGLFGSLINGTASIFKAATSEFGLATLAAAGGLAFNFRHEIGDWLDKKIESFKYNINPLNFLKEDDKLLQPPDGGGSSFGPEEHRSDTEVIAGQAATTAGKIAIAKTARAVAPVAKGVATVATTGAKVLSKASEHSTKYVAQGVGLVAEKLGGKNVVEVAGKVAASAQSTIVAREAAEAAAKEAAAKAAAEASGKSLLKKVPFLGAVMGTALAEQRLEKGDYSGAVLEFGSGILSTIPWIGTAASVAVDGSLLADDLLKQEIIANEAQTALNIEKIATIKKENEAVMANIISKKTTPEYLKLRESNPALPDEKQLEVLRQKYIEAHPEQVAKEAKGVSNFIKPIAKFAAKNMIPGMSTLQRIGEQTVKVAADKPTSNLIKTGEPVAEVTQVDYSTPTIVNKHATDVINAVSKTTLPSVSISPKAEEQAVKAQNYTSEQKEHDLKTQQLTKEIAAIVSQINAPAPNDIISQQLAGLRNDTQRVGVATLESNMDSTNTMSGDLRTLSSLVAEQTRVLVETLTNVNKPKTQFGFN